MKRRHWFLILGMLSCSVAVYFFLIQPILSAPRPAVILCLGDSLTEGQHGGYVKTLRQLFVSEGLLVKVQSLARPGHTSGEYLDFMEKSRLVDKINPHFVVLMLGTNDVRIDGDHTSLIQYFKNMRRIIRILKGICHRDGSRPIIFLGTILPIFSLDMNTFSADSQERISREIVPAIKLLGKEEGLVVIDIYSYFLNKKALLPGLHPNQAGYRLMAKIIFKALLPYIKGVPSQNDERLPDEMKGKIAFQSDRTGNDDIFVITGKGLKRVTTDTASDGYPCFSPDGKQLVFESNRSGRFEIYVTDLNGQKKKVYSSPTEDRYPFWTQDGKFIYFTRMIEGKEQVFRYIWESNQVEQVTRLGGRNSLPAVSTSGDLMLITSNKLLGWHVYIYNLKTGIDTKLSKGYGGCRARFSHSDEWIAWVSHKMDHKGDIFVTKTSEFSPVRLTLDSTTHDYCPAFSPDDRYIVYASGPALKSGNYDLKIIHIASKKIWTITHSPAKDWTPHWTID